MSQVTGELVLYTGGSSQTEAQQQTLMQFDPSQVSPEEVGQLIHHLQEEIKIIKLQLENLPGYAQGKSMFFLTARRGGAAAPAQV